MYACLEPAVIVDVVGAIWILTGVEGFTVMAFVVTEIDPEVTVTVWEPAVVRMKPEKVWVPLSPLLPP